MATSSTALPLWAAVFGTLWQILVLIWGIVTFPRLVSFCRGANTTGQFNFIKNAMLLSIFSYAPLTAISITFMWVGYAKNWTAGPVFVMLPVLAVLLFMLFLFATVNDITKKIDVNRRGRKRLPMQAPPTVVQPGLSSADAFVDPNGMSTPRRTQSAPPELPLQDSPM